MRNTLSLERNGIRRVTSYQAVTRLLLMMERRHRFTVKLKNIGRWMVSELHQELRIW